MDQHQHPNPHHLNGPSPVDPTAGDDRGLGDWIKERALSLGFDRVGIAAAHSVCDGERFHEWLRQGFAGSMDYLARNAQRRLDPERVLPEVRSIISLARVYRSESEETAVPAAGTKARIARYAVGEDYHLVIEKDLKRLIEDYRRRLPDTKFRYYVDTGPVLERYWAQEAGVGWIGKNTCSIDPDLGSYFFLAELLTDLDLAPDAPAVDQCGACTACIEACPTGALVAPWQLDSRLCISYLTIEERRPIPRELWGASEDWIFGCDICQEVCPWNAPPRRAGDVRFEPRPEFDNPSLQELSRWDRETFQAGTRRSAVRRARFEGFTRSVALALCASSSPERRPALEAMARRDDLTDETREIIEWGLKNSRGEGSLEPE